MNPRRPIASGDNRGIRYEDRINNILKSKGLQPLDFLPGGATDAPDGIFSYKERFYPLEMKRDLSADFTQIELRWNKNVGFYYSTKSKNRKFIPFLEKEKFLDQINSQWTKTPRKFTVQNIGSKEHNLDLDNFPDTWKKVRINKIEEFYNSKSPPIHYIQIGTRGFYYMGKDIIGLKVPRLNGRTLLRARVKTRDSSEHKYGFLVAIKLRSVKPSIYDIEERSGRIFPPF